MSGAHHDAELVQARTMLATLAAGLDHGFVQAGSALAMGVGMTDRIVDALAGVEAALADGAAGNPADGLATVATRIAGLPGEQAARRATFAGAGTTAKALADHVGDVFYTLRLLGIYAMNVKIAGMGEQAFVAVIDEMLARMAVAEANIHRFQAEIDTLADNLARIARAEQALAAECARAVPAVPDQLTRDAVALRAHRQRLAGTARESGTVAGAIRNRVGAALGALQIGDITRQRLEHVVTALEMLAQDSLGAVGERHVLRLLAEQLADTADDFDRDGRSLIAALDAVVPDARALQAMHGRGGSAGDTDFLHDLEASVARIEAITRRLRGADTETAAAATTIVGLVGAMSERTMLVRRLQRHVQQLAFNIGLKSRRLEQTNGGIIVAADHIRAVASKLDIVATGITAALDALDTVGGAIRQAGADPAAVDPGVVLRASIDAIRAGAIQSDHAVEAAGDAAIQVLDMLTRTAAALRDTVDSAQAIRALAARFAARGGEGAGGAPDAEEGLFALLPRIAALYTMASERTVHQRHLLPGMASVEAIAPEPAGADDLFDDALF